MSSTSSFDIVVLSSGEGTNLQRLIDYQGNFRVSAVVCDRACPSLDRARAAGIDAIELSASDSTARSVYDKRLAEHIESGAPQLVVLAGFMRILGPAFIARFGGRILNLHPSLLPQFPGLDTHRRVIEAGATEHGATVHFATEELDGGPSILQYRIAVRPTDTVATLSARVHAGEYIILPRAIEWYASGRLRLENGKALLDSRVMDRPVVVEESDDP